MKILHIIGDLDPKSGGTVTAVLGLAKAQAGLGHKVSIASTDYGLKAQPSADGVSIRLYPCSLSLWRWSRKLTQVLPDLIKETDVVHLHGIWEHTILAGSIASNGKRPYVLSAHGMLDQWALSQKALKKKLYLRCVGKSILCNAAAIHFTSKREQLNSLDLTRNLKTFVCPLGVQNCSSENRPTPHAFQQRFPELKNRRIILFLGRLHPKKQPDVAIRAFHKAFWNNPDICMVIAGAGKLGYLKKLEKLISQLELICRVLFTGILNAEVTGEAYCSADLFVLLAYTRVLDFQW